MRAENAAAFALDQHLCGRRALRDAPGREPITHVGELGLEGEILGQRLILGEANPGQRREGEDRARDAGVVRRGATAADQVRGSDLPLQGRYRGERRARGRCGIASRIDGRIRYAPQMGVDLDAILAGSDVACIQVKIIKCPSSEVMSRGVV